MKIYNSLYLSIFIIILGQVMYHILIKNSESIKSPFELIVIAYATGLFLTVIVGFIANQISINTLFYMDNIKYGIGIGVGIIFIELGYIFAYRNGLTVAIGLPIIFTITTIILLCISIFAIGEIVELKTILGILFAIIGIWLMNL